MTERVVELQAPTDEAWQRVVASAQSVGKVEEAHDAAHYLIFKARYGLNPVRLRISVLSGPQQGTAQIEIQGRGQDIWGVASRKVIDRFCAAL